MHQGLLTDSDPLCVSVVGESHWKPVLFFSDKVIFLPLYLVFPSMTFYFYRVISKHEYKLHVISVIIYHFWMFIFALQILKGKKMPGTPIQNILAIFIKSLI